MVFCLTPLSLSFFACKMGLTAALFIKPKGRNDSNVCQVTNVYTKCGLSHTMQYRSAKKEKSVARCYDIDEP